MYKGKKTNRRQREENKKHPQFCAWLLYMFTVMYGENCPQQAQYLPLFELFFKTLLKQTKQCISDLFLTHYTLPLCLEWSSMDGITNRLVILVFIEFVDKKKKYRITSALSSN